jgi:hypothetical protein
MKKVGALMKKTWDVAKDKIVHLPKIKEKNVSPESTHDKNRSSATSILESDEGANDFAHEIEQYISNIYDPLQETTQGWVIRNPRPLGKIEQPSFVEHLDIVDLSVANYKAGKAHKFDAHKVILKAGAKMTGLLAKSFTE